MLSPSRVVSVKSGAILPTSEPIVGGGSVVGVGVGVGWGIGGGSGVGVGWGIGGGSGVGVGWGIGGGSGVGVRVGVGVGVDGLGIEVSSPPQAVNTTRDTTSVNANRINNTLFFMDLPLRLF
jgi:hypothetical protein